MEGDVIFYQRYQSWLEQQGRHDLNSKVASFAELSAAAGGVMVLAPLEFMLTDVAAVTVILAPLLLLLLVVRLWLASRASRVAALYTQGLRTGRDRVYAFLSDPWLRLRHTFWSYATRAQRLVVLLTALLAILSATTLTSNLSILGQTSTIPLHVAFGYPSQPALLADIRSALKATGNDPALLRLMGEGLRARHRNADAQTSLAKAVKVSPSDAVALNNLGVLKEEAKDLDAAHDDYANAANGVGSGAAVAKWNLARLADGSSLPTAQLSHRDRIRARRYGAKKPLWALCSLQDQRRLLVPRQTLAERTILSFSRLIRGEFANFSAGDVGRSNARAKSIKSLLGGAGLLCLLTGAIALIWLPLTTLPLLPQSRVQRPKTRWRRWLVEVLHLVSLLLPGLRAVFVGRVAIGAALMLALCVLGGLWFAIDVHGLVSSLVTTDGGEFFAGVQAPTVHAFYRPVGHAAGVALLVLFAANFAFELRMWLRRA